MRAEPARTSLHSMTYCHVNFWSEADPGSAPVGELTETAIRHNSQNRIIFRVWQIVKKRRNLPACKY